MRYNDDPYISGLSNFAQKKTVNKKKTDETLYDTHIIQNFLI